MQSNLDTERQYSLIHVLSIHYLFFMIFFIYLFLIYLCIYVFIYKFIYFKFHYHSKMKAIRTSVTHIYGLNAISNKQT